MVKQPANADHDLVIINNRKNHYVGNNTVDKLKGVLS